MEVYNKYIHNILASVIHTSRLLYILCNLHCIYTHVYTRKYVMLQSDGQMKQSLYNILHELVVKNFIIQE